MRKIHKKKEPPKTPKRVTAVLAKPGDPLVLSNGKVLPPVEFDGSKRKKPENIEAKEFRSSDKRSIAELPAPVHVMNGIAAVFMYTMLGLTDRDICEALKLTAPELKIVRGHAAYGECFEIVGSEFVNANSSLLHARIAAYASDAIGNVYEIAANGEKESNKLRANIDILDRAGVSKKEAPKTSEGSELRIVVTDGDKNVGIEINGISVGGV